MIKKLLIYVVIVVGLISSGCSYAIIKNRVGREDGLTRETTEVMQPKSNKIITIKKINGKLVVVKEAQK